MRVAQVFMFLVVVLLGTTVSEAQVVNLAPNALAIDGTPVGGCFDSTPVGPGPGKLQWTCSNGSRFYTYYELQFQYELMHLARSTEISNKLTELKDSTAKTNSILVDQIKMFTDDFRNAINRRFDQLPKEIAESDAIKNLRQDILKQVDDKIAALKKEP